MVAIILINSTLTEDTSNGSTKIIKNEKYQAISTAKVTKKFCLFKSPYLYTIPATKQNVSTTSAISGPDVILYKLL